ncbi:hypothetical protein P378_05230 [Desulforamulus profundi]|uniref:Uncharacterized protein n=1 Tax=Desulforamulus profundi TaxID=1383067 RepID=A0A2C6LKK9_9FIRM|nr:hypothetical protein [Desulforamulus profundi]PHJ39110.1 hypothetical protein P378_05230 [Desulforamulus profundi]
MSKKEKAKKRKKRLEARRQNAGTENKANLPLHPGPKSSYHVGKADLSRMSPLWQEFYRRVIKQVKEM